MQVSQKIRTIAGGPVKVPVVIQELGSILVVAAFKLVLGKVVECLYLRRPNVVLLLQEVEIVGLVLLEQLDKVGIHEEAHNAVCLSLQINSLDQRQFPSCMVESMYKSSSCTKASDIIRSDLTLSENHQLRRTKPT